MDRYSLTYSVWRKEPIEIHYPPLWGGERAIGNWGRPMSAKWRSILLPIPIRIESPFERADVSSNRLYSLLTVASLSFVTSTISTVNQRCSDVRETFLSGIPLFLSVFFTDLGIWTVHTRAPNDVYHDRLRPYHVEYTSSRPITEVKQRRARLVLGWVTAWEYRVS